MENNIPEQTNVNTHKYAEDCTMETSVRTKECSQLQSALDSAHSWANENKMELNAKKTKDMWICFNGASPPPPLRIGDAIIERVDNFKLLGTWLQKDLKWNKHVEETTRKASKNLYCLRECRRSNLPVEVGLTTYLTKIWTILEYCSPVWGGLPQYLKEKLKRVQRRSLRIIGLPHNYNSCQPLRRKEMMPRQNTCTSTLLRGIQVIFLTNNVWIIVIMTTILDTETEYILSPYRSLALNDTETVSFPER